VLVPDQRRVPVDVAEERLLPAVDHLDRLACVEREQAGVHVHGQVFTSAESTADASQRQPDPVRWQAERGADLLLVCVQPLGRDVEVDPAGSVGHRQSGFRAEERLVLHADLVGALDHDVGLRIRIALADLEVPEQVAGWV
jgi:hypothetical protein